MRIGHVLRPGRQAQFVDFDEICAPAGINGRLSTFLSIRSENEIPRPDAIFPKTPMDGFDFTVSI